MNLLSIVILNYNGRHYLEKFLPDIITYSEGHRIYVVDNGSTDDSFEFLRNQFSGVRVLSFTKNEGFAGGYNMALEQIESEYYLIVNSDIEVTPGWISPMIRFMETHRDYAACQPKIRSYSDKELFEYAGAAGGFLDLFGYPFCRGRIFNTKEKDFGQYDDNTEIFWASGACMMVRSEAFHSAKGFDASFFAHMEEIDLFWRLKKAGWKVCYLSESIVFHVGGGTLPKSDPRKTFLNFRNNLAMLIKNLSLKELVFILPLRFTLDMTAACKFLLFDSMGDFLAVLKAYASILTQFGKHWGKRKAQPLLSKNRELAGFLKKPVLYQYYFKRRRKFSELRF